MDKEQRDSTKKKERKIGNNKGKKYEKPLSLYGLDFDKVIEMALKTKPQN